MESGDDGQKGVIGREKTMSELPIKQDHGAIWFKFVRVDEMVDLVQRHQLKVLHFVVVWSGRDRVFR